jgi:PAS domain S-box-containing protein
VIDGLPYITYFPAIILATFFGGFGPGVLATLLSAAIAWSMFMPTPMPDAREVLSIGLFLAMAAINVTLVALLNRGLERIFAQRNSIRTLLESAPNGIVVMDEQGNIKLVNAAVERLFGYRRNELLGRKVEVLFPIGTGITAQTGSESAGSTGPVPNEHARRKDGSEFPVEVTLNSVPRAGGKALFATVVDISERKRSQDRQQLLIRELQHRTRNLFTIIQTIAARTLAEGRTMAEGCTTPKQPLTGAWPCAQSARGGCVGRSATHRNSETAGCQLLGSVGH